jgi:hypothetical protein
MSNTVLPPTIEEEKIPPGFSKGFDVGLGSVVAEGMERNVVPDIMVVLPCNPGGARDRGMVVGPGITRTGVPPMTCVEKPADWPAGSGGELPRIEFMMAPIEWGDGSGFEGGVCIGAVGVLVGAVSSSCESDGAGVAMMSGM